MEKFIMQNNNQKSKSQLISQKTILVLSIAFYIFGVIAMANSSQEMGYFDIIGLVLGLSSNIVGVVRGRIKWKIHSLGERIATVALTGVLFIAPLLIFFPML